jgi:outer membrane protein TolC
VKTAHFTRLRSGAAIIAVVLLLSGCATVSQDRGFSAVSDLTQARIGKDARLVRNDDDARALAASINAILSKQLTVDQAVQVALLNNRSLQATYWNVGIAEADLVQAGRLQNPAFGFKRTHQGSDVEIERSLTVNLVNLLTAPLAQRIERRRFEQTKLLVASDIQKHAAETRRAYYEAVAALQGVAYARQVNSAAEASADLAGRMAKAGNWSQLDLAREQAFYAEATASVGRAQKQAMAAREQLTRLMGLWGANANYSLPDRLPDLPANAAELGNIEMIALRDRVDIQAAKLDAEQTAASLGLTQKTRLINVLDIGVTNSSASDAPATRGYELSLEIPLFDWGSARVAKSEAIYMQSVNTLAQAAINARSEARQSYLDYRTSYDLAKHYRDQVIPLRKKISDETQLRYNGMLLSVFELLADSREQAAAVNDYIGALKDYWIADTNLEAALGGRLPARYAGTATNKEITR